MIEFGEDVGQGFIVNHQTALAPDQVLLMTAGVGCQPVHPLPVEYREQTRVERNIQK